MLDACVLIQTRMGKAAGAATAGAGFEGVISGSTLSGPYDVIAMTRTGDAGELARLIVGKVQSVEGIVRTLTCPAVRL